MLESPLPFAIAEESTLGGRFKTEANEIA